MKRTILSALTVLVASAALAPIASAVELASFNLQATRLEALDARTKNDVHKLRIEHLNNQTKAIEDIQATRLEALDARTKAVDNIQAERLNALDARTKNDVHKLRIEHLNNQSKAVEDIQGRIQVLWDPLSIRKKGWDNSPVPIKNLVMIVSSIEEICQQSPDWSEQWTVFDQAESLAGKVCAALQIGLLFARIVLETDLTQRAQEPHPWPECPQCGHRLRSKGFRPRQLVTLIGVVR